MHELEEELYEPVLSDGALWDVSALRPNAMLGLPLLNPYGLGKFTVLVMAVSLVVLVPLDWAFPSGTRATQLGVENADRAIPHLVRLTVLAVMILYLALTGRDPSAYGFVPGRPLMLLAAYMFISTFYPGDVKGGLIEGVKSIPWIFAAITAYRLALGGHLREGILRYAAGAVVIFASIHTIVFCMDPDRRIGQNADSAMLLWCIPLLLLSQPPRWAFLLSGLASIAILVTVKRGAMLALIAGAFVYFVLTLHISSREHKIRHWITVALAVALVGGGLAWQWENLRERMHTDLDHGELGSGRSWFYRVIISEWHDSGIVSILLGKGFVTVRRTMWHYGIEIDAHSDWLEILHDMGLLGVLLFAYVHICILIIVRRALWKRDPVVPSLGMAYTIFVLRNVYSQCVIGPNESIYFGLLLGYAAASTSENLYEDSPLCR